MAVYCTNCGAEMKEKDEFCAMCGAPAKKSIGVKKGGNQEDKKYRTIGIAVIAIVALFIGGIAIRKIGGTAGRGGEEGNGADEIITEIEEDDVLVHLKPWMGEWIQNFQVHPEQGSSLLNNFNNEGHYKGHILSIENSKGRVHVNEEYIDFTDVTKNQKDRFPVDSLKYYKTEYGADAFEDADSGIRIVFYEHFKNYEEGEDYGEVMKIQAYVGTEEPEINYFGDTPIGFTGHFPASDGWAVDTSAAFVRIDQ